MKTSNARRQFIFAALAISSVTIITLIALELMLQVAAHLFPRVEAVLFRPQFVTGPTGPTLPFFARVLPDNELVFRGNPQVPEHDANGFRNRAVPDTTDIVAIGDSLTYGTSVAFDQAWPRVLEKISSCRVYSMAVGAYGPLQYAILAKRALQFKPRLLLVGIYFGNDFFDAWQMYLRNPSEYSVPQELLIEALLRELRQPLSRNVTEFFLPRDASLPLTRYLAQNSALWGFSRAIKNKLFGSQNSVLSGEFHTAVAALTAKQLEYSSVFEGPDWRTILTSGVREAAQKSDDPRIQVGFWLTQWAIQNIDQLAKRNGIAAVFILLPTKESVFVEKVKNADDHKYFKKLTTEEDQHRKDLIEYMDKNDLAYIDMAPSLRSIVRQPFFENADGHPNAVGQEAIATAVQKQIGTCKH